MDCDACAKGNLHNATLLKDNPVIVSVIFVPIPKMQRIDVLAIEEMRCTLPLVIELIHFTRVLELCRKTKQVVCIEGNCRHMNVLPACVRTGAGFIWVKKLVPHNIFVEVKL